jgi:ADP-heptose:LPS heptosyltransferase
VPSSILIVKPSSLGDIVHTLPAVAMIKRTWPKARLRWLVNPEWAPVLEGNPDIDELIPFPRRELAGISGIPRQIQWLRKMRAGYSSELVLDFQGLLRSAIVGRACRSPRTGSLVGLSDSREGARLFYDQVAVVDREHAVERYLKLAAAVGVDTAGPLEWKLPQGNRPAAFSLEGPFILLHPFSRGAGKSLSAEDVQAFCQALPLPVVLAGRATVRVPPSPNMVDLLNQTSIPELIWLTRQAQFVVSVDSGPMHIAAAVTPNLLSIHLWSDPALVGPHRPEAWIWKDRTLFQASQLAEPVGKRLAAPDLQAVAGFVADAVRQR